MKILKHKTQITIATAILALSLPAMANAAPATLDDVVAQLIKLQQTVSGAFTTAFDTMTDLIYEKNPNLGATMASNIGAQGASQVVKETTNNLSAEQTFLDLKGGDNTWSNLAKIYASDIADNTQAVPNVTLFQPKAQVVEDGSFELSNLISPAVYSPLQEKMAKNFVQFVSDGGSPLKTVYLGRLNKNQIKRLQDSDTFQKYLVAKRTYIALRNVGMSNLYHLIAERIPQADLGVKVGLGNQAVSAAEVADYAAKRRIQSAQWYANMADASPTTIAREQLNVQAEILKYLQQLHQDNERIIATLSVIQLEGLTQSKAQIDISAMAAEDTVKRVLSGETDIETATASSNPTGQDLEKLKQEYEKLK